MYQVKSHISVVFVDNLLGNLVTFQSIKGAMKLRIYDGIEQAKINLTR